MFPYDRIFDGLFCKEESLITCQFERLVSGERLVKYRMTSFGVAEIKLKRKAPHFCIKYYAFYSNLVINVPFEVFFLL